MMDGSYSLFNGNIVLNNNNVVNNTSGFGSAQRLDQVQMEYDIVTTCYY